jgi:hypothetical protein
MRASRPVQNTNQPIACVQVDLFRTPTNPSHARKSTCSEHQPTHRKLKLKMHASPHVAILHNSPHVANLHNSPHVANLHNSPHVANLHNSPHVANLHNSPHVANLNNSQPTSGLHCAALRDNHQRLFHRDHVLRVFLPNGPLCGVRPRPGGPYPHYL